MFVKGFKIGLWFIIGALILSVFNHQWNIYQQYRFVSQFIPRVNTSDFQQTKPSFFVPFKVPHAVLLLHSYPQSTEELKPLTTHLKTYQIPYYIPQLTGLGLKDYSLLYKISPQDWVRDAINAYDVLESFAEEISVIGHSSGALLALILAKHRPIKHLILSSPYLVPNSLDRTYKTLLEIPFIYPVFEYFWPVFERTRSSSLTSFTYLTAPSKSLKSLWDLQNMVDLTFMNFQTVTVFLGEKDTSIDLPTTKTIFQTKLKNLSLVLLPKSDHSLLNSLEQSQIFEKIISILRD
ncbi:MAG: alpha/beta fold hydrolase [Proteobacteria bacterium]|nr:alpha/beta fold hydrolase [Pseudomonadota bacterium]